MDNKDHPKTDELRSKAEAKLRQSSTPSKDLTLEKAKVLMHELEVHQLELEMQNQELRETQHRLEELRDQYTDLFDFAPVGYLVVDKKGVIKNINLTACMLLGLERSLLMGKPLSAYMSSGQSIKLFLNLNEAFNTGNLPSFELTMKDRNNRTFTALLQGTIPNYSKNSDTCRISLQDITELKAAAALKKQHDELQLEKEKIQRYLDLAPVVFLLIDSDHNVQMINQKGCELLGYKRVEMLGKNWFHNFVIDDGHKIVDPTDESFQNNKLLLKPYVENFVKCKNGEKRLMGWTNIALLDNSGNQIGTLSSGEDITQRKKEETSRQRYMEELETMVGERTKELSDALENEKQISEMKSSFVSIASHELRTPITIVLSSIILIEKYGALGQFDKQKKHFNRIKSSINHFNSILDDFLSLDKLEKGIVRVNKETFDLPNFINFTIEEMEVMLKEGQKISYTHSGQRNTTQDKKILRNILLNLLSNAIKYSEKDIELTTTEHNGTLTLKIKDQGIGIPDEDSQFLFKRFFRAKNAEDIPGTGLGLSIVKRYLDLLQGSIEFTSQENKGSIFTVQL
ncbi:sensor histidine kinase [Sediminicola sp. YIK13]|uniref:sensor histidine kinase n=1 Tax=Sediminicola sp. YIK13 TaxID=1453352 RepID=UPI0007836D88|nr:PAS domain-containing sensor histidine kinase [Sediminicola sp. YIK13]